MPMTAPVVDARRDGSLDDRLGALFAAEPAALVDPYELYADLREQSPVHVFDDTVAIVSTYPETRAVYRDHARFQKYRPEGSHFGERAVALLSDDERELLREVTAFERLYMSSMNGELHKRVRGAVQAAFTPKRVAELGKVALRQTQRMLDDLSQQAQPNLIELANRVPLLVIMEMLGAPYGDADLLKRWGDEINDHKGRTPIDPEVVYRAHASLREFRAYVSALIDSSGEHRSTSLLSGLHGAFESGQLSREELEATMVLILFAGHETTTNLIGNGIYQLLRHPDQWAKLTADPELAKFAVEEILRFDPPVQAMRSLTACEVELRDVTLPPDFGVMMLHAAANRDTDGFADPDTFDIMRTPNNHLTLGFGAHFCLGGPLARLEGKVVLETFARRFPDAEIAAGSESVIRNGQPQLRGLSRLQVKLGEDRGESSFTAG
jgi:cytochrome P450